MKDFFDRLEIIPVLQGFNPWWSDKPCTVPKFRRLAFEASRIYLKDASLRRAILLSGPRRVGKTTILQQIADGLIRDGQDPKSVLYLSLDHPLLKLLPLRDILALYHESVFPEGQPVVLLLDEIQYSRGWETEIKLLVDHQPHYRILATGSASVEHRERLAESGVGRWITVPVPTLSFYEFVHIRGEAAPVIPENQRLSELGNMTKAQLIALATQMRPLQLLFQRYLLVGGFPETARQENIGLCQRLLREDVVERVLKRDMTALFGVRNVNDLEKLFIYLCLHSGGILAHNTCARALETSTSTVANHLALLEQANLIYRLPPAALGGKKVLKARNKYYLVDAALRNAILLKGEEIFNNPDEMGLIVETTVLRHLYAYYYRDTPEIVYWRESASGKEVDIIVRSPAYLLPFEIKYKEKPSLGQSDGLVTYCRAENPRQAYMVTKRDRDFSVMQFEGLQTRFIKVPAHILCYLLGQAERLLWVA
ncbi:MAG TPA: ATP-binding protein [Gammaproteobacteria bacterium]|nr:ATP-binding protein [Gammaproteobacteria bacterium]